LLTLDFKTDLIFMANHKSAIKRHKQSLKRRERNRSAKSAIKTAVRATSEAATKGDKTSAETNLKLAVKQISKARSKGILHKKTASRKISRIAKKVAAKSK
jgi:small subunit ribosomal protein S20